MIDLLYNTKEYLPKCWIARIAKYWEKIMPTGYPKGTSSFMFVTDHDEKVAVFNMEKNLDTEDSIIDPSVIPENNAIGAYLGTYDVVGEVGVETLLSPEKLPEDNTGAIAYHYNAEDDSWEKIDDVTIIDGYAYGVLDSFSPIAVFSFCKDSYYDTSKSGYPGNVYVCNGVATKIYMENDKIIAESGYGKKTELTEDDYVIGGTYDGSDIESTNLSITGVTLRYVIGGSAYLASGDGAHSVKCSSINLTIKDSTVNGSIIGAGVWCCADEVNVNVDNCIVPDNSGVSNGVSQYKTYVSNKSLAESALGLGAAQWIKHSVTTIKNSTIGIIYAASQNGYSYTEAGELYVENTKAKYICVGQSNGTFTNVDATIVNCEIEKLNTVNRGHFGTGKAVIKGCTIDEEYVFADPKEPDPSMADVLGKVSLDIDKNTTIADFCVGSISNVEVTDADTAKKYIGSIKISRNAAIIYTRNADVILKDIIAIK